VRLISRLRFTLRLPEAIAQREFDANDVDEDGLLETLSNKFRNMPIMIKTTRLNLLPTVTALAALFLFATRAGAATGDIYETNLDMILRITSPNTTPITFAAGLSNPKGLVFDGTGKLYVADASRGSIFRFSTPDGTGNTFASNLDSPVGVTFDAAGTLFVGESGNGSVSKFNVSDGTKTSFATGLGAPSGLAFASNGNLFVADFDGGKIFQVTPDGTKTTFASGLNFPAGLAFDATGTLFAADSGTGSIFKFAPDGSKTTFVTGLERPYGLAFEAAGTLVVSDNGNGSTYRYTTGGDRSTIFSSDFNTPQFVAIEPAIHQLLNISTRGFVGTGDHLLIGGFNIGGIGPVGTKVVARAMGPSLSKAGVADPLADPVLEILDGNGTEVAFNDNWEDASDEQKITVFSLQPTDTHESGLQLVLLGGAYTAVVYGSNNTTGTALVEVYNVP
jgi:sugar lactone lactonase YvrE